MNYLDTLVAHLVDTANKETQRVREIALKEEQRLKEKPMPLSTLRFEKEARTLIQPARKCAEHHRAREQFYVKELEEREAILRERGVTMEAVDPRTGFAATNVGCIASGAISYGNIGNAGMAVPKFQARVDQSLLGDVERAKNKMIDHGKKAEQFEKYARAFACLPPNTKIELSMEDVHTFRLEA